MKHNIRITIYLVLLFLAAQLAGLTITNEHIPHINTVESGNQTTATIEEANKSLAFDTQRPETTSSWQTVAFIVGAIIAGTLILLLLIRFRQHKVWKGWFYLAVTLCMVYALGTFINDWIALAIAVLVAYLKVIRSNIIAHNISEVLIYGALGAIFVPMQYFNIPAAFALLIVISLYDAFAVWQSRHMVKLAQFQTESRVFAGLLIPYSNKKPAASEPNHKSTQKKTDASAPHASGEKQEGTRDAILGGGDIAFPLIFTGVVMKQLMVSYPEPIGFLLASVISLTATLSLLLLFIIADKGKFYPAMPFLSGGCFAGYGLVWLLIMVI